MDTIRLTYTAGESHNSPSHDEIWKHPTTGAKRFSNVHVFKPVSVYYGFAVSLNRASMSTGIVAQYTDQGFAIAADSLRLGQRTSEPTSTKVQKIFPIQEEENRRVLAYGLAGATVFTNEDGVRVFDFAEEFKNAIGKLKAEPILDMPTYVKSIGELVNAQLKRVRQEQRFSEYPDLGSHPLAQAIFLGYYHDVGMLAELEFRHQNQSLLPSRITRLVVRPEDFRIFSGSKYVREKMFNSSDRRFSRYRTPSIRASQSLRRNVPPDTLAEAKTMVRNYLQACIDNQKNDNECAKIGGYIHAATVTPEKGFEWFLEPNFSTESTIHFP